MANSPMMLVLAALLSATQLLVASQNVKVQWQANPEPDITGYSVYYAQVGQPETRLNINGTSAIISGLQEGRTYTFSVTAWDSSNLESDRSDSVTWYVNTAPQISPIGNQIAQVGVPFTLQVLASDPDPNQTLTFTLLAGAPADATLSGSGLLSWTPSPAFAGSTNVVGIQVTDNGVPPRSASITFKIVVQAFDGSLDSDGDGFTNLEEFEAGTDPNDASSSLRILSVAQSGANVTLQFTVVAGKTYTIQASDPTAPNSQWVPLTDQLAGQTGTAVWADIGAGSLSNRLYRVLVEAGSGYVASAPAGFMTLGVGGEKIPNTPASDYLGLGLVPPLVYQGRIGSFGAGIIVDARAHWLNGQFEGANGLHYLELTSGLYAGLTADISSTDGSHDRLVLDRDLSPYLSGNESYDIRPHWTLATVFGPQDESGLATGTSATADQISLEDQETGVSTAYFYQASGSDGSGWRTAAAPGVDESDVTISPGQGAMIVRGQPADVSFKLFGAAPPVNTLVGVSTGLNIVPNPLPMALSLQSSGLFTGDPATGLAGSVNGGISGVDRLLIDVNGVVNSFYYQVSGSGGPGWRALGNPSLDVGTTLIAPGSGFVILRQNPSPFVWVVSPCCK